MFENLKKEDKKVQRINMRITQKQIDFIKKHNLSPSKIFDDAIEILMATEKRWDDMEEWMNMVQYSIYLSEEERVKINLIKITNNLKSNQDTFKFLIKQYNIRLEDKGYGD